jgi:ribose-phosphate pyrophosphokinase
MILLNGEIAKFEKFPNGEVKFITKGLKSYPINQVTLKYEDDSDLIKLMFVSQFLGQNYNELHIDYMPYSRMDRVEDGSFFTLKYVCDFINILGFDEVYVLEPHSDVTPALLNNCHIVSVTTKLLWKVINHTRFNQDTDYLFYPDAGAQKRYAKLSNIKQLVGLKHRDFASGKITSMKVIGDHQWPIDKVIIVDDISSYGGTFVMAAKELKEIHKVRKVYLLVTHCENSIFNGSVLNSGLIDGVFTTDSLLKDDGRESDLLHVFKLEDLM